MLIDRGIAMSALAVCNPAQSPRDYVNFFAGCGISEYDIIIPDATVGENPPSIGAFYQGLFDLWLEANRAAPTADIRIVTDMVSALLGNDAPTEGVGYKPIELCTVMTDGSWNRTMSCGSPAAVSIRRASTSSHTRSMR